MMARADGNTTRGIRRIFHSRDRVIALSDGVFAVAITFMGFDVLAAANHSSEGESLGAALVHEWPVFLGYLIGFLTILVCWINHQVVYEHVTRLDAGLVWINGLQMALVVAVPFPTALLAEHLLDDDARLAFAIYGVAFFLIAFSFWLTSTYIAKRQLASEAPDPGVLAGLRRCYAISVVWTVLALAMCAVSLPGAIVMWVLMFAVFAFPLQFAHWARRNLLKLPDPTLT